MKEYLYRSFIISFFFLIFNCCKKSDSSSVSASQDTEKAQEFTEEEILELENTPVYNLTMDDVMLPNGMTASKFLNSLPAH